MNTDLSKLIWLYSGNNENKFYLPINIINAHTQRIDIYNRIEDTSEDDVLVEAYAYLDYVKNALSEGFIPSPKIFGDLLRFITDTHKVVVKQVNEDRVNKILQKELEAFSAIRKALKKNPNRAGIRIKLIDTEKEKVAKRLLSLDNNLEQK